MGSSPRVVDWNNDGRKDLVIGHRGGQVRLYLNTGSDATPAFSGYTDLQVGGSTFDCGETSVPWVVDWNNDGKKDLLVGEDYGRVLLLTNTGTDAAPSFSSSSYIQSGSGDLDAGDRAAPVAVDWNGDGAKDLLVGEDYGRIYYYENVGTDASPIFSSGALLSAGGSTLDVEFYARFDVADWNGDGALDIVSGGYYGNVAVFLQVLPEPEIDVEVGSAQNVHAYDFGSVPVGSSATATFTVRNEGTADLVVSQASGLAAPFSISPVNGSGSEDDWSILPGATQVFTVTVAPVSEGPAGDSLALTSNDPDEAAYSITFSATAVTPEIDVESGGADDVHVLDFGSVTVSSSATAILTIRNEGTGLLVVSEASGLALPFSVSPTNGAGAADYWAIGASGTRTFSITFAPTTDGTFSDTLLLANTDLDEDPYAIAVSGTAVDPEIDVELGPADDVHAHDIGSVLIGSWASVIFTLRNEGIGDLVVSQAYGLASPFSIGPANGSGSDDDWTIAEGETQAFTVTFSPVAAVPYSDVLYLSNNDSDEALYSIALSGAGAAVPAPEIDVEALGADNVHAHGFGPVALGSLLTETFTVRNEGTAGLVVSQASGLTSPFSISPLNGSGSGDDWAIASGGTQVFTVTFAPVSVGMVSDLLVLVNTDSDEDPYHITFSGTGVAPEIDVGVGGTDDVHAHHFGPLVMGSSATATFTVRNEGTGGLVVSQVDGLALPFSISPTNGAGSGDDWTIAAGAAQAFTVTFAPTGTGPFVDTLDLISNDGDEATYSISLTGTGTEWTHLGTITGPQGQAVDVYDCVGTPDILLSDLQVKFGKGSDVSSIKIGGSSPMEGLGLVISGASSVGTIKDGRKGWPGALAFIASSGPLKGAKLKSGIGGLNLNGLTLGGITFAADIDGDGQVDDLTAFWSAGAAGSLKIEGDTNADVWIGGADSKGLAFKSFQSKTGGFHGDFWAMGNGGKLSFGGDFGSSINIHGDLKGFQLKGGDFKGELNVTGLLGKLDIKAGKTGGGWFRAGSTVNVGGLLKSAKVSFCETDDGGEEFGIFAGSFGTLGIEAWKLGPADLPFTHDDFAVRVV